MTHARLGLGHGHAGMREEARRVMHEVLHGHEHEVALAQAGVRQGELAPRVGLPLHPDKVAVDGTRPVALLARNAKATKLLLHAKQGIEQDERRELGADLGDGVGDRQRDAVGRIRLVGVANTRDAGKRDGVDEGAGARQVLQAIADIGPKRHEGAAWVGVRARPV